MRDRRRASASRGAERPGLFLVGDPKQSIFAWRNADLAAYDDFAERLEAAGGERLTLDANFRSRARSSRRSSASSGR